MQSSDGLAAFLDGLFQEYVVQAISAVLFFDLVFWDDGTPDEVQLPFVVAWLVCGAA